MRIWRIIRISDDRPVRDDFAPSYLQHIQRVLSRPNNPSWAIRDATGTICVGRRSSVGRIFKTWDSVRSTFNRINAVAPNLFQIEEITSLPPTASATVAPVATAA